MRFLAFLVLFVAGAVAGMAATPLLPENARAFVSEFQQEVRYMARLDEMPADLSDATPRPTPTPTPLPPGFPTPTPTSPPPPTATPTPRPTPTPTPVSLLSAAELDELRYHALRLINNDRADFGLPPVTLGKNQAAQDHAEDMIEHDYFGHWWADGRKPYMVYSQTGGMSYASENAATSGWTDRQWLANNCGSFTVRCTVTNPEESITEHQWGMMYDDAHANWGHRDNILGETHRAVNIGVAFNGRRTTFVQHFEGGAVEADGPPTLDASGVLSFSLVKRETGIAIGSLVSVAYDPLPTPKTPAQIDRLKSYCTGGGFTTVCPITDAARILEPPEPGYFYSGLDANEVVASTWTETDSRFTFTARTGSLLSEPGVYTVAVWRDTGGTLLTEQLVSLSLFVEPEPTEPMPTASPVVVPTLPPPIPVPTLPPFVVPTIVAPAVPLPH